jgi:hypothetical protein
MDGSPKAFSSEVAAVRVKKMRQNKNVEHDPIRLDRTVLKQGLMSLASIG